MQNTVQKSETIRMGSGVLKINDVNVGAIKSAGIDATYLIAKMKFANAKLPPRRKLDKIVFKSEIVELDLVTINQIFGGEVSDMLAADNTETGNDRKIITFDDLLEVLDLYPITFENTDSNGKVFGIKILQGYASNNLAFDFPEDDDLESVASIPVEFEGYPNSSNQYFEIYDEQGIS